MASWSWRGVAKVVVPDAGEEKVRGVPKGVNTEGSASPVNGGVGGLLMVARLKNVLLTVTTFGWLKTLKASRMRRRRIDSLKAMMRVTRASNWKTEGVVNWLRTLPGRRSLARLPSLFGSLPTSAE